MALVSSQLTGVFRLTPQRAVGSTQGRRDLPKQLSHHFSCPDQDSQLGWGFHLQRYLRKGLALDFALTKISGCVLSDLDPCPTKAALLVQRFRKSR
jgi:hypothetical protein